MNLFLTGMVEDADMSSKGVAGMMRALSLTLLIAGVAACNKKEPAPEMIEAAAPVAEARAPCPAKLQKLMEALPARTELEGQKESDRGCKSSAAWVVYGKGDPGYLRFELNALRYEDADLGAIPPQAGQELLDNLRKTMEVAIVVSESRLNGTMATAGDPIVVTPPRQRAQLPREVALPNGIKAMVSKVNDGEWTLQSVLSDDHMLQISYSSSDKDITTDGAASVLARLAREVNYAGL